MRTISALRRAAAFLLLMLAPLALPASALAAQAKIALVIGNGDHTLDLDDLPVATRDARQIATALGKAGFSAGDGSALQASIDLDRARMIATLRAFDQQVEAANDGAVAMLYFAGHGIARERRGDIYLLPTDGTLRPGVDLNTVGIPLADVLQVLRSRPNRTVIVVINACRNVVRQGAAETITAQAGAGGEAALAGSRGGGAGWGDGGDGLGLLSRGARRDLRAVTREGADYFVAFSTSPDRGAYDSDLFSSILADEIQKGRQDVLTLFKRVGERVASDSRAVGRLQLPTYEVGLYGAPPCFGECTSQADPDRFFDCAGCPWMRAVPPGAFTRGSPNSEPGRKRDEIAASPARIDRGFAIGMYEVTRAEWRACERAGACASLSDRNKWQSDKAPVAGVTRRDAEAYVAWLSAASGVRYRLPTELEWEYAARAGARTPFFFGAEIAPGVAAYDYSASYQGSPRAEYRGASESVGSFPGNEFGLYDMHGNVWEWTMACEMPDQPGCATFSLRGGSFKSAPAELRAANRFQIRPDDRREDVGLRVVREM